MGGRSLLVAGLIALAAPAARADDDARAVNQRAVAAFALGQYGEAAELWERCFALKPQPALLYNAAQAHRLAGHKERALLLYQNYLRLYGRQIPNRSEVEQHVEQLARAIETDQKIANAPPVGPSAGGGERDGERVAPPPRGTARTRVNLAPSPPREGARAQVNLAPPPPERAPIVAAAPGGEPSDQPRSRRGLWIGLGVAAGAVVVAAVVLGVVLGAPSDPSPSRGAIAFGGL